MTAQLPEPIQKPDHRLLLDPKKVGAGVALASIAIAGWLYVRNRKGRVSPGEAEQGVKHSETWVPVDPEC